MLNDVCGSVDLELVQALFLVAQSTHLSSELMSTLYAISIRPSTVCTSLCINCYDNLIESGYCDIFSRQNLSDTRQPLVSFPLCY